MIVYILRETSKYMQLILFITLLSIYDSQKKYYVITSTFLSLGSQKAAPSRRTSEFLQNGYQQSLVRS